ncbi:MAG: hypothetical protein AABY32_02040 [Nanoarchaeota archaeon]
MKIRNGFVSNSSSSSFVIMTSLENHKKALGQMDEYSRKVMEKLVEKSKLFGRDIVSVSDMHLNDGESWNFRDFDYSLDGEYEEPEGGDYDDCDEEDDDDNDEESSKKEKKNGKKQVPVNEYGDQTSISEIIDEWEKLINKNPDEVFSNNIG